MAEVKPKTLLVDRNLGGRNLRLTQRERRLTILVRIERDIRIRAIRYRRRTSRYDDALDTSGLVIVHVYERIRDCAQTHVELMILQIT